jgi:hypothetical protein
MLAEGNSSRPATHIGRPSTPAGAGESRTRISTRPCIPPASRIRRRPGARPRRRSRTLPVMRRATSTSSSSPAAWPMLSLTSLKRSRSRNSTAKPGRRHAARARSRPTGVPAAAAVGQAGQRIVGGLVGQLAARRAGARRSARRSWWHWPRPVRGCARSTRASSRHARCIRRSCAACRARPLPMWWATKVSRSWSREAERHVRRIALHRDHADHLVVAEQRHAQPAVRQRPDAAHLAARPSWAIRARSASSGLPVAITYSVRPLGDACAACASGRARPPNREIQMHAAVVARASRCRNCARTAGRRPPCGLGIEALQAFAGHRQLGDAEQRALQLPRRAGVPAPRPAGRGWPAAAPGALLAPGAPAARARGCGPAR